ncbi:MAG: DUF262 domain-containing protein [Bacteroidales bacterium]|nr:DUF262 domain-containing protein [Bacteroidales bacterium]
MASIELLLKSGENKVLLAATENREDYYLVDSEGNRHMTVKLDGVRFKIVDDGDVIEQSDILNEKLDNLALKVADENQTEIDENEFTEAQEITPYNPDDIRVHQKQFSIKFIEEMIENGDIDFTPDFQRNFVWNSIQKSKLIESLLLRIPLPIFYFAEDKEGRLTIVDGLQRLTTIKEFMNNEFPLNYLEYLNEGVRGRYYKSNPEKKQVGIDAKYYRWFNMSQFAVNVIDPSSPYKVKYDIFRRINTGGRPLNNQEIRNCLSSKKLRALLLDMTALDVFKEATNGSVKNTRMADREVALRFISFYDAYKKDATLKTSYDGYMEYFLDTTTEDYFNVTEDRSRSLLELFENAMKNAVLLFGGRNAFRKLKYENGVVDSWKQLFNKALFVAWSVQLADIPHVQLAQKYPQDYLLEPFARLMKEDEQLMYFISYGTNGKSNLEYTFLKVAELIKEKIEL